MIPSEIGYIYRLLATVLGESKQGSYDSSNMQYQFNCPVCADENDGVPDGKYNLEVNLGIGKFHCWKCGFKGPISYLFKRYGGQEIVKDYNSLVKQLKESKYYDLKLFAEDTTSGYLEEEYLKLPETFTKINLATLSDRKLTEYLEKRKITQDIIDFYNIGYTTREEANWQMRNRLIIPSYDVNGDLNYWVGRDYMGYDKKTKYKNCDNDKNKIVFNENKIVFDSDIILVEGIVDSIYFYNAVPLMGKVLSKESELYRVLREKANANIVICLDSDTELEETKRIYRILNYGRLKGKIRYIRMSDYKDFGEAYESGGKNEIINLFKQEKDFTEFELLI